MPNTCPDRPVPGVAHAKPSPFPAEPQSHPKQCLAQHMPIRAHMRPSPIPGEPMQLQAHFQARQAQTMRSPIQDQPKPRPGPAYPSPYKAHAHTTTTPVYLKPRTTSGHPMSWRGHAQPAHLQPSPFPAISMLSTCRDDTKPAHAHTRPCTAQPINNPIHPSHSQPSPCQPTKSKDQVMPIPCPAQPTTTYPMHRPHKHIL
jgi:hypothetical protein